MFLPRVVKGNTSQGNYFVEIFARGNTAGEGFATNTP